MPAIALRALLLCLLATAPAARAERQHYALDPVHTRILFAVDHAGFSSALGTVSGTTGTLEFDPADLGGACVQARIPLEQLELGDGDWNAAARRLLGATAHPVATFASKRVDPIDASHALVTGTLTLNGVARDVQLAVTFHQLRRHPLPPFRRTAGFSATGSLSRRDFGITRWPGVIGDAVELRIEAEAVRARGGPDAGDSRDMPPAAAADDALPAPGLPDAPDAPDQPVEPSEPSEPSRPPGPPASATPTLP